VSLLKSPIIIIVGTQLLFTFSDLLARYNMRSSPFSLSTFLSGWFLTYFLVRQVAMFGQLYVFTQLEVGKTMAFFGATSIVVVNVLGFLLLGEQLSPLAYAGVALAVAAFIVLAFST
jgi:multidrug transporter EmrE-like cation transporter